MANNYFLQPGETLDQYYQRTQGQTQQQALSQTQPGQSFAPQPYQSQQNSYSGTGGINTGMNSGSGSTYYGGSQYTSANSGTGLSTTYGNLFGGAGVALGIAPPPGYEQYAQSQSDLITRLSALQTQLAQAQSPSEQQLAVNDQILKAQNQLNAVNPIDLYNTSPGLKDVGITQGQLNAESAQLQSPIQNSLNNLLLSKSILGEQQQRSINAANVGLQSAQAQQQANQALYQLQNQYNVLPESVRSAALIQGLGLNLSPQLLEYRQALQQGIIPKDTPQDEAQFMLHPEERFQLQTLIDPVSKMPYQVTIDKLAELRKSRGESMSGFGGTNAFGAGTNSSGTINNGSNTSNQSNTQNTSSKENTQFNYDMLPLTDSEKASARDLVTTLNDIKDLAPLLPKVTTGAGVGAFQSFMQGVPIIGSMFNNPDYNTFVSKTTNLKATYLRALGGVRALSPQESALFESAIPNSGKVSQVNIDSLNSLIGIITNQLKSLGLNPSKYPSIIPQFQLKGSGGVYNSQSLNTQTGGSTTQSGVDLSSLNFKF